MRQGDLKLTFRCMEHDKVLWFDGDFQFHSVGGDLGTNTAILSPDVDGLHCPDAPVDADTCRARWRVDIDQRLA